MATTTQKYVLGSVTTLATTALNSMANNALVACTPFNNTQGQIGDGYVWCDLELVFTFGTNPTASTGLSLWLLQSQDGSTYEDGSSSLAPGRLPDVVFPVTVSTVAQKVIRRVRCPWGLVTPLLQNTGTGQALAASGNTLKIRGVTMQMV